MNKDCIFCKIVAGEIPSYKVYEDTDFMAFLDISPLNKGHMQVIPKKHYRWTWDVPNFGAYWEAARKVALGAMKALGAPMVEFLTHGTEVEHAHIWVVPIYEKEAFINVSKRNTIDPEEMKQIVAKIKEEIK
jgi:histidine triad (HIT) family protein